MTRKLDSGWLWNAALTLGLIVVWFISMYALEEDNRKLRERLDQCERQRKSEVEWLKSEVEHWQMRALK